MSDTEGNELEAMFRGVVESSPDIIVRQDPQGRYHYANPAWERLTGQKVDEVMGQSALESSVMSDPERWHRMLMVAASGTETEAEFVFNSPALGQRTFLVRFVPERRVDGCMQAVFAVGRDVTERRQSELRFRESKTLTAGVISAIPDILFEMNRQGQYLNVWTQNPDVLASQKSTIRGKSVYDLLSRENAALAMDALRKADEQGFAYGNTIAIEQTDGEVRWYEHSIGKKPSGTTAEATFIVLSRDVTERKQAEQRLAEAQRIGRMGSWEIDFRSGELIWSDEIYRIFEVEKSHFEMNYELFLNLIHPDDRAAVDQMYAEAIKSSKPYAIDHRVRLSDNRIKYVREFCEIIYDEHGVALMACGTVQDITEIKEAQLELERSQTELRRLAEYRNTVLENERRAVARAMHEEFAQMVAITHMKISQLNSMTCKRSPEAQPLIADTLAITDATMRKMRDMVATIHPTTLEIGIVPTLQCMVEEFKKKTTIKCVLEVPEVEPELTETQVILLFRLVQEALANITLHAGALRVDISFLVDGDHFLVKVEDNGKGITTGDLQVPGFGIISMREQATALGGTLLVEPGLNGGVAVSVRFPCEYSIKPIS